MAWTATKTFTASSALTAAELNTYLRDNPDWLKDALATLGQTSDSSYAKLTANVARLSQWKSSQSIGDGSDVRLQVDDFDSLGNWGTGSSGLVTVEDPGWYYVTGWAQWAANSSGWRSLWIEQNSATSYNKVLIPSGGGAVQTAISTTALIEFAEDDTVALWVRQNSGSTLSTNSRLDMFRVSMS